MTFTKKDSTQDKNARSKRRSRIGTVRRKAHNYVKERERGRCGICKWNAGSDMHHFFGRSSDPENWREAVSSLIWVCRNCHPHGYIHNRGDAPELEQILAECVAGTRIPEWMPTIE